MPDDDAVDLTKQAYMEGFDKIIRNLYKVKVSFATLN